jgi:hypothetical protein
MEAILRLAMASGDGAGGSAEVQAYNAVSTQQQQEALRQQQLAQALAALLNKQHEQSMQVIRGIR